MQDMLAAIAEAGGSLKQTRLMYRANLSHPQMRGYLDELLSGGLLSEEREGRSVSLRLTPDGRRYLEKLAEIRAFEKGFGL